MSLNNTGLDPIIYRKEWPVMTYRELMFPELEYCSDTRLLCMNWVIFLDLYNYLKSSVDPFFYFSIIICFDSQYFVHLFKHFFI